MKIKDLVKVFRGSSPRPIIDYLTNSGYRRLKISDFSIGDKFVYDTKEFIKPEGLKNTRYVKKGTLILTNSATPGMPVFLGEDMCLHDGFLYFENLDDSVLDIEYLYCWFLINRLNIINLANGSVFKNLKKEIVENLEIDLPSLNIQQKIVGVFNKINNKIILNNQINHNLDRLWGNIFRKMFWRSIELNNTGEFNEKILYDVLDVVDNRGKTPPLVEYSEYPIIDVKALSGSYNIINYSNCIKYVNEDVYNTFFRSGHPKRYDILISTVGSLAEMKIFMENKGTIAQNVVGLRDRVNYPLYTYQYLKFIKNDLISYDIGSVQPSIKVTQFMKHNIFIPKDESKLKNYESISENILEKMFNIYKENESLMNLRDTLLPKLMNGEINLDKVTI